MERALEEKMTMPTTRRKTLSGGQQKTAPPLTQDAGFKKRTRTTARLDEHGFMLHPERWNRETAELLARREAIGDLTQDHWGIIDCLRQYYSQFGVVPPVRLLERGTGLSLQRIHELFPNGLAKGVCRVAGVPSHDAMVQGYTDRCFSDGRRGLSHQSAL